MDENLKESLEYQTLFVNCCNDHDSKKMEEKSFEIDEKKEDGNELEVGNGA